MASELELKYGCNPNQEPSRIYMKDGSELPVKVLSGKPGYINFLTPSTPGSSCASSRRPPAFPPRRPSST